LNSVSPSTLSPSPLHIYLGFRMTPQITLKVQLNYRNFQLPTETLILLENQKPIIFFTPPLPKAHEATKTLSP
jgi:hypothetical protein